MTEVLSEQSGKLPPGTKLLFPDATFLVPFRRPRLKGKFTVSMDHSEIPRIPVETKVYREYSSIKELLLRLLGPENIIFLRTYFISHSRNGFEEHTDLDETVDAITLPFMYRLAHS